MGLREKRKYIRLRVYHLLKYKKFSDTQDSPFVLTTLKDIGAGGVCFVTEENLPMSTLIDLRLNFPGISAWVSALAKVVWVKTKKNSKTYEIGAQFVEIDESIQKLIDDKIKSVYHTIEHKGIFSRFFPAPKKR
jgi:c-di-GMP-binding flagellar brake protein YcgR